MVTGVQTCALPILWIRENGWRRWLHLSAQTSQYAALPTAKLRRFAIIKGMRKSYRRSYQQQQRRIQQQQKEAMDWRNSGSATCWVGVSSRFLAEEMCMIFLRFYNSKIAFGRYWHLAFSLAGCPRFVEPVLFPRLYKNNS